VRKHALEKLDDALQIALQLEVWTKDVKRQNRTPAEKRVREAGKDLADQLRKRVDELETQMQQQSSAPAASPQLMPDTAVKPSYATATSPNINRPNWKDTVIWYECKLTGNIKNVQTLDPAANKKLTTHWQANRYMLKKAEHSSPSNIRNTGSMLYLIPAVTWRSWTGRLQGDINRRLNHASYRPLQHATIKKLLIVRIRLNCNINKMVTTLYVSPYINPRNRLVIENRQCMGLWKTTDQDKRWWLDFIEHSQQDELQPDLRRRRHSVSLRQKTAVNARMTWRRARVVPDMRINETVKIPNLSRVWSARSLLPVRHTNLKVNVLNADSPEQIIKKDTVLGTVSPVKVINVTPAKKEARNGSATPVKKPNEKDVVAELIKKLPDELAGSQLSCVKYLIRRHEA